MTAAIVAPYTADTDTSTAEVVPIRRPKGHRRAFMNNKGGVGKTTGAVQLGAALARRGNRVLCVDMDAQANMTRRLGVTVSDTDRTIYDILMLPTDDMKGAAGQVIQPCGWDVDEASRIDVIPCDLRLDEYIHKAHELGFSRRLRRALWGVTDPYDYTIFDCHSTLGAIEAMVVEALDADGDGVYVPVEPGTDAISGAARVIEVVAGWAGACENTASVLGVIVNQARMNTSLHQARVAHLPASLSGVPVLSPIIPFAVKVAEVQDQGVAATSDRQLTRDVTDGTGRVVRTALVSLFDELAAGIDTPGGAV